MSKNQHGLATVEFAVVGSVAILLLLGVIEIARMLFAWNTIVEVTRRAARTAIVCPIGDTEVLEKALMSDTDGNAVLSGLTTTNIAVTYLNAAGAETNVLGDVKYARAQIAGYQHVPLIPFVPLDPITLPAFSTTLPAESLGLIPDDRSFDCMDSPE